MQRALFIATTSLVALIGAGPGAYRIHRELEDTRTVRGLRIEGVVLPRTDDPARYVETQASLILDEHLTVSSAHHAVRVTRRELGMSIDVDEATHRVRTVGHSGELVDDLAVLLSARAGDLDVALPRRIDAVTLTAFVEAQGATVERAPVPARLDIDRRVARPARPGVRLDVEASVVRITDALRRGDTQIELAVAEVHPEGADTLPPGLALDTTLGRFRTRYATHKVARAHNVELAGRYLHGAILEPGATLSFNERVGARTRRNGFREAKVIDGGRIVPGMGGGVCQAASTLHAAALRAGLEIVDARPHSRPSSYIPMGLDATVSYPDLDLVIRNPYAFSVAVFVAAEDGEMVVEILGRERPANVDIARHVLGRRDFPEEVVMDPALPNGQREVVQQGIRGARVARVRTLRRGDGHEQVERTVLSYPPTPRIVHVGTGGASSGPVELAGWGALGG